MSAALELDPTLRFAAPPFAMRCSTCRRPITTRAAYAEVVHPDDVPNTVVRPDGEHEAWTCVECWDAIEYGDELS